MVSATSRIVRARSRWASSCAWRLRPSRSSGPENDSPGLTPMRTISQSDSTRVPPVTEAKSPPDSRMTGADSPVIALSSTEATPSITSPSSRDHVAGFDQHDSVSLAQRRLPSDPVCRAVAPRLFAQLLRDGLRHASCARSDGRLRLAAAFGHRLGEIGEQHREPQPERDRQHEGLPALRRMPAQRLDPQHGGQDAADVDDEHHRVAPLHARGPACEGRRDRRRLHDRRV